MIHALLDRLRTTPWSPSPKIAGRCRGGGSELVLACDMRFAALGKGVLGQPRWGRHHPGAGGTVRLPQLVGRGRALRSSWAARTFPRKWRNATVISTVHCRQTSWISLSIAWPTASRASGGDHRTGQGVSGHRRKPACRRRWRARRNCFCKVCTATPPNVAWPPHWLPVCRPGTGEVLLHPHLGPLAGCKAGAGEARSPINRTFPSTTLRS